MPVQEKLTIQSIKTVQYATHLQDRTWQRQLQQHQHNLKPLSLSKTLTSKRSSLPCSNSQSLLKQEAR
jgi:hypothetical protein